MTPGAPIVYNLHIVVSEELCIMKEGSGQSDAIADYLNKVWETGDTFNANYNDAVNAVLEIRRSGRQHAILKNADIPALSDEKLELAVMDWIRSKIKDWLNPCQDLKQLPKPCQTVYSCRAVADEVGNGGFLQLFYNAMLPVAELSVEGFLELGAPKLSRVTEQALELYRDNKDKFDRLNDGTTEGFAAFFNEAVFDRLDRDFALESSALNIAGYIRANAEFFGDKL